MSGIKKYFEDSAKQWVLDGYNEGGYNYPTAFHRVRVVSNFISSLKKKKLSIIDLGCGGGDLAFYLAQDNPSYEIIGLDQSKKMLDLAEERRKKLPQKIHERIRFIRKMIDKKMDLDKKFDIVTAMGFIGYLPNDKILFDIAKNLLKPGGYLVVSCRNRLFNMNSLTFRTREEIKKGEAAKLIGEIEELYLRVPAKDADKFIRRLKKIAKNLPEKTSFDKELMKSPSEKYSSRALVLKFKKRQTTPKQLKENALKCGFAHKAYYGVHPHLLDPNLNKMLPPQIFNKLSDSLTELEHLPISLAWSSVFIGAFQKNGKR